MIPLPLTLHLPSILILPSKIFRRVTPAQGAQGRRHGRDTVVARLWHGRGTVPWRMQFWKSKNLRNLSNASSSRNLHFPKGLQWFTVVRVTGNDVALPGDHDAGLLVPPVHPKHHRNGSEGAQPVSGMCWTGCCFCPSHHRGVITDLPLKGYRQFCSNFFGGELPLTKVTLISLSSFSLPSYHFCL